MSICKECLHNEVCKYGENRSNGMYCTGDKCKQYKPTADVVEVVRCKDCKYFEADDEGFYYYCVASTGLDCKMPIDYCSYGERRADNG